MGPPMEEKAVRRQTLLRNQQIAAALELGQSRKSMRLPYLDVTGKTQMGLTGPQRGHSKGKSTMFTGERGSYSYSTKCGPLRCPVSLLPEEPLRHEGWHALPYGVNALQGWRLSCLPRHWAADPSRWVSSPVT
jgi:hypothetical protein